MILHVLYNVSERLLHWLLLMATQNWSW